MSRTAALGLALILATAATTNAQDWARKMFEGTNHDFGSVARGADAEYLFELSNPYKEDVHIASVRSSCGCTTPRIVTDTLKTYEKGAVAAKFNTRSFLGQRSATITVVFDKPFYAEVQLQVDGYIRSDVVLEPGMVEFGTVDQGSPAERRIQVDYAGRGDWRIVDVRSGVPYLKGRVEERQRSGGQVGYDLIVTLADDAPAGFLKDQITLVTSDQRMAEVPVEVQGRVTAELTVSPDSLLLGVLKPGQTVTKQLVVKAKRPFRVLNVKCDGDDDCFTFKTPEGAKPLHLVPITFTAGDQPGKISRKIIIETDLGPGAETECSAFAQVVPVGDETVAGR